MSAHRADTDHGEDVALRSLHMLEKRLLRQRRTGVEEPAFLVADASRAGSRRLQGTLVPRRRFSAAAAAVSQACGDSARQHPLRDLYPPGAHSWSELLSHRRPKAGGCDALTLAA